MSIKYQMMRFPEGKAKAVTLSYDDGCRQDIRFSDVISGYGLKCTFNLTGRAGVETQLKKEEVQEYFLDRGHEIAVHGACHRAPGLHRPIIAIQDVLECRMALEEKYDMIIRGMAYPDSGIRRMLDITSYEKIKNNLKDLDIVYARTLGGDNDSFNMPSDWYAWMPTAHHKNPQIFEYIEKFLELDVYNAYISNRNPRLFYMWGHSFEFDRDNNWDKLEKICEKLSGHDDIWYATNIEIYEYTNAYNSLVYSADGSRIYNPTLYTLWFEINKVMYTIKPDEIVKIEEI